MTTINDLVLTFVANALWQVTLIAGGAAGGAWLLRHAPAKYRHALWAVALALSFLLPLSSLHTLRGEQPGRVGPTPTGAPAPAGPAPAARRFEGLSPAAQQPISVEAPLSFIVISLYSLLLLYRSCRLWQAWRRTAVIRRAAYPAVVPASLRPVIERYRTELGVGRSLLFCSQAVSGPLTAGAWRPAVILPERLLTEASAEVLAAALGHELAHIRRRDFAYNLLYELLYLPLSFHPAAALAKRAINRTRELACDELVCERLMDARAYARSLVSLAESLSSPAPVSYALGVNDADILEERVMRLVNRSARRGVRSGKTLTLLIVTVLCAAGVVAGSLSLRAGGSTKAQGDPAGPSNEGPRGLSASSLLKGAIELNRAGRWREAAQLAEAVIQMPTARHAERCEAYASGAYSYDLLPEPGRALRAVKLFGEECGDLPDASWPRQEVRRISNKLSGIEPATAVDLNRGGEWGRAAELAEGVLSRGGASPDERCAAYVDAAFAHTRLKRRERATGLLKLFEEECGELPAAHWQRAEAQRLRAELE